jgi:hypothetical protein
MRLVFHTALWPIIISVVLLAVEGKLLDTWNYEDFVGPWHVLWFLGMWLLGITPSLFVVAGVYFVKRVTSRRFSRNPNK